MHNLQFFEALDQLRGVGLKNDKTLFKLTVNPISLQLI